MKDTVNILGTEYKVLILNEDDDPKLKKADGYMDQSVNKIVVVNPVKDDMSIEDLESYKKKVLRHEIMHAFLYESGLWNNSSSIDGWARSEEMTDWIAIQFPKMLKAFQEVGCL